MKLYYTPGACSLSPHITAREAGIELELDKVDRSKKTESGVDFLTINPKGYVPALQLDDGEVLTEGPAIVQFLADSRPEKRLAPPNGTRERYRLQEALGYINSEIHKTYSPLFNPSTTDDLRRDRIEYLRKRYALIEKSLGGRQFLVGDTFTVADAYLFTVTQWAGYVKFDLSELGNVQAFQKRIAERPHVQEALRAEGLLK